MSAHHSWKQERAQINSEADAIKKNRKLGYSIRERKIFSTFDCTGRSFFGKNFKVGK